MVPAPGTQLGEGIRGRAEEEGVLPKQYAPHPGIPFDVDLRPSRYGISGEFVLFRPDWPRDGMGVLLAEGAMMHEKVGVVPKLQVRKADFYRTLRLKRA